MDLLATLRRVHHEHHQLEINRGFRPDSNHAPHRPRHDDSTRDTRRHHDVTQRSTSTRERSTRERPDSDRARNRPRSDNPPEPARDRRPNFDTPRSPLIRESTRERPDSNRARNHPRSDYPPEPAWERRSHYDVVERSPHTRERSTRERPDSNRARNYQRSDYPPEPARERRIHYDVVERSPHTRERSTRERPDSNRARNYPRSDYPPEPARDRRPNFDTPRTRGGSTRERRPDFDHVTTPGQRPDLDSIHHMHDFHDGRSGFPAEHFHDPFHGGRSGFPPEHFHDHFHGGRSGFPPEHGYEDSIVLGMNRVFANIYDSSDSLDSLGSLGSFEQPPDYEYEPPRTTRSEAQPTVDELIAALPPVIVDTLPAEERKCPICTNDYHTPGGPTRETERGVRLLCYHVLGKDCLKRWLDGGNTTCPICRSDVYGNDTNRHT